MTRQTYDRAPRLTKLATAHISKGDAGTLKVACFVFANSNIAYKCLAQTHMHPDHAIVLYQWHTKRDAKVAVPPSCLLYIANRPSDY